MAEHPEYELVVFGATGFVGKILCQHLLAHSEKEADLKWAIAGRSEAKLAQLVTDLGPSAADLPCLIADAANEASLHQLCAQTQVVISTVGPYALYGEPLVKVCVETGTDYCDLTGGAHQPCTQVKMRVKAAQGGISGGTAASGINLVKEAAANPVLRQELANPYSLCPPEGGKSPDHPPPLIPVQYDAAFKGWVAPFVMAEINTRIVFRSGVLLGSDFQYDEGMLIHCHIIIVRSGGGHG